MPKRLIFTVALFVIGGACLLSLPPLAQSQQGQQGGAANPQQAQNQAEAVDLNPEDVSYAIGMNIGKGFASQDIDINLDQLYAGIAAGLGEQEPRMSEQQVQATVTALQRQLQQKQMAQRQAEAKKQQEQGAAFLKENQAKEGVQVTDSGLQYKVLQEGDGDSPGAEDRVVVHYTGTYIDGEMFDSSRERGEPAEFQVGRVIKGWSEGLQLMKEGGRYKLFVPSDLGYGPRGHPRAGIPGNATLIFDVELIEVKSGQQQQGQGQPQSSQ